MILDRNELISLSKKNLTEQTKHMQYDIARDKEFLDGYLKGLDGYTQERQLQLRDLLAERERRIHNLEIWLHCIALVLELLDEEEKRLKGSEQLSLFDGT